MITSQVHNVKKLFFRFPTLIAILIVLYFIRLSFVSPAVPDTWTHLAIGKWVVTEGKILSHTDVSIKHTEPSLEWISHSWLSDALLYLASVDSPLRGAILLGIPTSLLTLYLLYEILFILQTPQTITYISLLIATAMMGSFWHLHPYIFIPPLFLGMLLSYLRGVFYTSRYLWLLPLLFFLMANMAGGIITVPLLWLGLTLFMEIFMGLHKKSYAKTFVIACILSVIATLFNPYGLRIWSYILTMIGVLQIKQWYTSLPGLLLLVNQNTLRESPSSIYLIAYGSFAILLLFGLSYAVIRTQVLKKHTVLLLLPTLLYGVLGWIFIRFIPTSFLLLVPLATLLASHFFTTLSRTVQTIIGAITLFLSFCILIFASIFPIRSISITAPRQALSLIQSASLQPNFLTTSEYTGYMLFHLFPTRMILDAQDDLFDEHETISIQYLVNAISEKTLERVTMEHKIQTAIVNKDASGFAFGFEKDPTWNLLYFDAQSFVFSSTASASTLKNPPPTLTHLALGRNLGFDPKEATATAEELREFVSRYPDNQSAIGLLATVYRIMNRSDKAEKILNTIPKNLWTYTLYTEMGRIKASQGLCKSAEKEFETAISMRSETRFSRAILDLAVLSASCLGDKARAKHLFNRYNSFIIHPAEREEVRTIAEQFGIMLDE